MSIKNKIEKIRIELYNLVEEEGKDEEYYTNRYKLSIMLDELILSFYKNKGEVVCK